MSTTYSKPLGLRQVTITDGFWQREMELVRKEVIPYQWDALNDRVPDAAPSYCMHNFHAAARLMARRRLEGMGVQAKYTMNGFVQLPEEERKPDPDHFYGFVFQDSDCYKWLEAVAYSLMNHPDPVLEATADQAIDDVCAAQAEDGYLDTCYILGGMDKRFTYLKDHHELYCLGHLVEAAVAYHQATGKDKLLKAACRFADCCAEHLGKEDGKQPGYPGHEIAEMALIRLYEETGEERYLNLACYFIDERGQEPNYFAVECKRRDPASKAQAENMAYYQAHKPVRDQDEAVGHAVRAMYLYSGMADAARITGDEKLLNACQALWRSTVNEKLYITGGVGGTHMGEAFSYPYDLPNDTAYSETCAAIGLVFFARRMLQIQADSRYGDVMEQALYNTVLSGMALDGKSFFYVNPLETNPTALSRDERVKHVQGVRQKWFGCACCPPNIARLVASLGDYAYTASDDTLYVHLYVSGTASAVLNGTPITLHADSTLPWQEKAAYTIRCDGAVHGTIAFRTPDWCDKPTFLVPRNGKLSLRNGYAYITGNFCDGDTIKVELPMRVRMMRANNRVREDAGQIAFTRGPITYCGEQADNGEALHLLRVHPSYVREYGVNVASNTIFGHETCMLEVPAVRIRPDDHDADLYTEWTLDTEERTTLRLIPYYCWANRGLGEMKVWWRT